MQPSQEVKQYLGITKETDNSLLQQLIHTLFENSTDAVALIDDSFRQVLDCNAFTHKILKLPTDQTLDDLAEILAPLEKHLQKKLQAHFTENEKWEGLVNLRTCANEEIVTNWIVTALQIEAKKLYCVRIQSKQYPIRNSQTSDKAEESVSLILNNMDEYVYDILINEDGTRTMRYITPKLRRIFGLKSDLLDHKVIKELATRYHPDDAETISEQVEKLQQENQSGKAISLIYRFFSDESNDYIWIDEKVISTFDADGTHTGNFGIMRDVSERVEADIKLKQSEERFRNLFDLAPIGMAICTLDGVFENVNESFCEELGYEKEELIGKKTYIDLTYPEDVDVSNKLVNNLIEGKDTEFKVQKRYVHKEGQIINTLMQVSSILDGEGKPKSLIGQIVNITGRIGAQNLLRGIWESTSELFTNENFSASLSNSLAIIGRATSVDRTSIYQVTVDPNTQQYLTSKRYEWVANEVNSSINDPEFQNVELEKFPWLYKNLRANTVFSGNVKDFEQPLRQALENQGVISVAIIPIFIKESLWGFISFDDCSINRTWNEYEKTTLMSLGTNIGRSIQSREFQKHLKESEERFKLLSEVTIEGILFTHQGCIVDANDQFAQLHGYDGRTDVIGMMVDKFIHEDDLPTFNALIEKASEERFELRTRKKDGSFITLESRGKLIPYSGFNLRVSVVYEITERKEQFSRLQQQRESFKNLVDYSTIGIMIDYDGALEYMNPMALKLFGFQQLEDIYGEQIHKLFNRKKKDALFNGINKLKHGEAAPMQEIAFKRNDGIEIEISVQFIRTVYEGRSAVQIMIQDLTAQRQLADEQYRAELAESMNKKLEVEIKQHKITQQKLEIAQKLTRNIIDSSLDMIMASDIDEKLSEFNSAACKHFGYSPKEILGMSPKKLYATEEEYEFVRAKLYSTGRFSGEIQNITKDGKVFTSYLSASYLLDDQTGEIKGAMGVSRDVTEMKRAESELIASEERYRDLFETMVDAVVLTDAEGNIIETNEAAKGLLEIPLEENLKMIDLIHESDRERSQTYFDKLRSDGVYKNFMGRLVTRRSKRELHVDISATAIFENGKLVGTRDVIRDITATKLAHEEIDKQNAKIKSIFESGEHLFWTVNLKLQFTSFNQNFAAVFAAIHGRVPLLNVDIVEPDDGVGTIDQITDFKRRYHEVITGAPQEFEIERLDKSGKRICIEVSLNPVRNEAGEVIEISGIGHDITDKKAAEEKIKEQSAKIESIFESSSHLIWSVDREKRLTSFNQNFVDSIKQLYDIELATGDKIVIESPLVTKEYNRIWNRKYDLCFLGIPQHFETSFSDESGNEHWQEIFLHPIQGNEDRVIEVSGIGHDITYKKQAERKIKDQSAKITSIFESTSHMMIWTLDKKGRITSYNRNFAKTIQHLLDVTVEEGDNFLELIRPHVEEKPYNDVVDYYGKAAKGESQVFEGKLIPKTRRTGLDRNLY